MSDNSWYDNGSNPPAGIICEKSFTSTTDEWSKVFIVGNKRDGSIVYEIIDCPNKEYIGEIRESHGQYKIHGKWVGEVYAFRPIKTERELAIEAAQSILGSMINKFPVLPDDSVSLLFNCMYEAGILRSKNES